MDFPRPSVSPSNIIGDLKDRFGFGGAKQRTYDEEPYYDEYDEYGYDDANSYDSVDQYAPSNQADPYDRLEYTTRSTVGRPSRTSSYASSPHLVSSNDIRATTSAYGVSSAATGDTVYDSYGSSSRNSYGHGASSGASCDIQETESYDVPATAYGDFVSPYKEHARQSSPGLDSLFTPSTGVGNSAAQSGSASGSASASLSSSLSGAGTSGVSGAGISAGSAAGSATGNSGVAGAQANTSTGTTKSTSREITLLQPVTYEDVASVARSVRLGNIVVLSLRSTDSALAKRVLDFSFGVASALDARVDCVADKTFIVMQGGDLSLEEHHRLQKQGIL